MKNEPSDPNRRALLLTTVALAGLALSPGSLGAATDTVTAPEPPGKPGDFDFLAGSWKIRHRRLKGKEWDEFDGEATCWTILGGMGSVEELRIPARDFSGMGLRLLDPRTNRWDDYWVNGKERKMGEPGSSGVFVNGVGTFAADDLDGDKPIKVRGVWDRITGKSHRWRQGVSRDGGRTWEDNWFMDWVRV